MPFYRITVSRDQIVEVDEALGAELKAHGIADGPISLAAASAPAAPPAESAPAQAPAA